MFGSKVWSSENLSFLEKKSSVDVEESILELDQIGLGQKRRPVGCGSSVGPGQFF
jgi:hypothetical protein